MGFTNVAEEVLGKRGRDARVAVKDVAPDGTCKAWSFAEIRARALGVVNELQRRCPELAKGDRVAFVMDNCSEGVVMYLAGAAAGWVLVPIDFVAPPAAWLEIIADADPVVVCSNSEAAAAALRKAVRKVQVELLDSSVAELHARADDLLPCKGGMDDPWVIMYTSGTTSGVRKGAVRTQRGTVEGAFNHLCHMRMDEKDVFLAMYPMHGVSTFFFSMMALYLGAQCVLLPRAACTNGAKLLSAIQAHGATFTTGGPSQFLSLIEASQVNAPGCSSAEAAGAGSLSQVLVSGAMTSRSTQERIRSFFAKAAFFEVYGSTECGMITMLRPNDFADHAGSVGVEPPGIPPVQFADPTTGQLVQGDRAHPGEILATTSMMFLEYWRKPSLSESCWSKGGLFRTGDMGFRDESGFIFLLGRADDRITLPSGASFYPSEVERVLLQHAGVSAAVVFLRASDNAVTCAVVPNQPGARIDPSILFSEMLDRCELRLAPALIPQDFWLLDSVDQLPRTATGKIQRAKLPEAHAIGCAPKQG